MPFQPGQSGNPSGRPKDIIRLRELAREHTETAITKLVEWMNSDNPKASVAACSALLDRGWGKPVQPQSGADGESPVEIRVSAIERVIIDPNATN